MLLAALVASLWGLNFVVIDWGMSGIPPLLFAAIRFAVVALAVLVVPRPQTGWRVIVGVGLFMSLGQFALLYTSLALGLSPGLAARPSSTAIRINLPTPSTSSVANGSTS